MRKVLVTGGTGFIGRHLVRRLLADPTNEITVFSRHEGDIPGVRYVSLDISNTSAVLQQMQETRPEWIFHLAGDKRLQREESLFKEMLSTNVIGTSNMLSAANAVKPAAFVSVGSYEEYGVIESPFRENVAPRPYSPCGVTRLAATNLVLTYGRQYFPACVLRFPVVYGPEMSSTASFLGGLVHAAKGDGSFPMTLGDQKRDFLHVRDLTEAFIAAAAKIDTCKGEVMNVCSGEGITLKKAAEEVEKIVGRKFVELGAVPYRDGEQMVCVGDPSLGKKLLGWKPTVPFNEGINELLETP